MRLRLPSPALVVACIALLFAAGGVSYAAVQATGSAVNIVDATTVANKAKVSSGGAVSITGTVIPAVPKTPFNFNGYSYGDGNASIQSNPTSATLALTGFSMTPSSASSAAGAISLYQYGETSPSSCIPTAISRFVGTWTIPAATTYNEQLSTPIVLKPLPGASQWCLITYASPNGLYTNYNGYVVSGTFTGNAAAGQVSPKRLLSGSAPHR